MSNHQDMKDLVEATVEGALKGLLPKTKHPSKEVLRIAIDEVRREYDHITEAYNRVSVKILTLSGAGFALLTFLYSSPKEPDNPLFIPDSLDGKVFYYAGLILTVGSMSALLYAVKPKGQWHLAPESDKLKDLESTDEREYLEYVKDRYITCLQNNLKTYHDKHKYLNLSFYPLVFGATILIVLKMFGTT